jgi:hypothetical protein
MYCTSKEIIDTEQKKFEHNRQVIEEASANVDNIQPTSVWDQIAAESVQENMDDIHTDEGISQYSLEVEQSTAEFSPTMVNDHVNAKKYMLTLMMMS